MIVPTQVKAARKALSVFTILLNVQRKMKKVTIPMTKFITYTSGLIDIMSIVQFVPRIAANASVYLVAGVGGFKNGAKRNVKTDLLSSCPRYRTKLIKQTLFLL